MRQYEPMAGENITETADRMQAMADSTGEEVRATFNDVPLTAKPFGRALEIASFYSAEVQHRHDEYLKSPQYQEDHRRKEEANRIRDNLLEGALMFAPEHMTLLDEEGWRKSVEVNTDGYGSAVMRYAERWARIMEGRMANGETVEDCADTASHLADSEGITGFMYGCAVAILAKVWVHGEALRRWHNLKTQLRDEGEKANESGGVLNPALLNLGPKEQE